jgi:general secretion pathway protein H
MTLIEVLIVIVIVAVAASSMTMGIGALTRSKLRSACMRIVSASRYGYHRAITQGKTVRVVLDIDTGSISIDEGRAGILLTSPDEERQEGDTEDATDPWETAKARLENPLAPALGSSAFTPIADEDGDPIARYAPSPLGDGIRVTQLIAPHLPIGQTEGRAAVYFFPSGRSEHAIIQLTDSRDNSMTVEIMGLTGRGIVHEGLYEPTELEDTRDDPRDPG